ncbi:hypothetical protein [Isoptericola sp. NPDC057191]|uniref:hypothetical protein n=1 Tax=Isoptericola sp. NPDC057191 TaxID=3346041 RepID=UPI003639787C
MRSTEEMYAVRDDEWWAEACANTVALAERIEVDGMGIDGHLRLPEFPIDDDCADPQQHFDHRSHRSWTLFGHVVL